MKRLIINRLQDLSKEIESLTEEKKTLSKHLNDIEIRLHQLVGAIYELQRLLNQADQPSDPDQSLEPSSEEAHK